MPEVPSPGAGWYFPTGFLSPQDDIASLFSLSRIFPDLAKNLPGAEPVVYTAPSSVKDTMNEISLRCEKRKDRLVCLDFTLSRASDSGIPANEVRSWFDAAHAEIHLLFDEIVSDEMISRLA